MKLNHLRRFSPAVIAAAVPALALILLTVSGVVSPQPSTKLHRIGVLTSGDRTWRLQEGLRDLGYIEGRDVSFEYRNTEGKPERLDELAQDLVRQKVEVIVAAYPAAVLAAKRATTTIPIVMVNTPDPVDLGIVASLARPGGNVTGTTSLTLDVSMKQLELLREAIPGASRIAVLWNPDNPWHPLAVQGLRKNRLSGVQLQILTVQRPQEFDAAFATMTKERADAVLILADPMMYAPTNRGRLADLALRHRLPSMGGLRSYADAGGMMSYWADETELYKRVANYVDRILKGANPDRLPIEQPTKYELLINGKTAKALGQAIPSSLLFRATVLE